MKDNIFSDYYAAGDWLAARWREAEPHLTSDFAIRVYAITISTMTLVLILAIAYLAKRKLSTLKQDAFNIKFPGVDPVLETSIQKRRDAIRKKLSEIWAPYRKAMIHLLFFGLFLPTTAFLAFCIFYSWFDHNGFPYLDLNANTPLRMIGGNALLSFLTNQMTHGAFFDVLEVFRIDYGRFTNNPEDIWFSGVVLLYRSLVSIFAVALAYAVYETLRIYLTLKFKVRAEIKRFRQNARKQQMLTQTT